MISYELVYDFPDASAFRRHDFGPAARQADIFRRGSRATRAGDVACADKKRALRVAGPVGTRTRVYDADRNYRRIVAAAGTAFEYFIISPVTRHTPTRPAYPGGDTAR